MVCSGQIIVSLVVGAGVVWGASVTSVSVAVVVVQNTVAGIVTGIVHPLLVVTSDQLELSVTLGGAVGEGDAGVLVDDLLHFSS